MLVGRSNPVAGSAFKQIGDHQPHGAFGGAFGAANQKFVSISELVVRREIPRRRTPVIVGTPWHDGRPEPSLCRRDGRLSVSRAVSMKMTRRTLEPEEPTAALQSLVKSLFARAKSPLRGCLRPGAGYNVLPGGCIIPRVHD